jgi:diaminopimelate epimerase
MEFQKYHALGNDYLVLPPDQLNGELSEEEIRLICHRNFGLGSDGILLGPLPSEKAQFGLKIYNPDGSEAEKSGNGLRIFSLYLWDTGQVTADPFSIETLGGVVQSQILDGPRKISVEMGQVRFQSDVIPVAGESREVIGETIEADGDTFTYNAATIGNPHCVIPLDNISKELACRIGPHIENHPNFPQRINMQLLKVLDRNTIQIEIWERGAGYTLASGSSSSAAAAVAHKLGHVDRDILVKMPGGEIEISIKDDFQVHMTGPATRVATMVLDDNFLKG